MTNTVTKSVTVAVPNQSPKINSAVADPNPISGLGYSTQLTVNVSDIDNDNLTITWSATSGQLSETTTQVTGGNGQSSIIWTAPTTSGTYTISISVSDGVNPPVTKNITAIVNGGNGTTNILITF